MKTPGQLQNRHSCKERSLHSPKPKSAKWHLTFIRHEKSPGQFVEKIVIKRDGIAGAGAFYVVEEIDTGVVGAADGIVPYANHDWVSGNLSSRS